MLAHRRRGDVDIVSAAPYLLRAAKLRELLQEQALVNGKRLHISAPVSIDSKIDCGATPVDFNPISLCAIKQIVAIRSRR